jgi:hypothetical protein
MKQFLIDTASNTLTAVALAGALVMAAPAAKADTRDVIGGLFLGLILTEVLGNNTHQPTQQQPQTVILRDKPNCGHFENLDYQGAYVVWTKFNACTGQVVAQEVRPRY